MRRFSLGPARHRAWLAEDQTWFSSSVQKELRSPRGSLVTHSSTTDHHRGQAHALITACGEKKTGDTEFCFLGRRAGLRLVRSDIQLANETRVISRIARAARARS